MEGFLLAKEGVFEVGDHVFYYSGTVLPILVIFVQQPGCRHGEDGLPGLVFCWTPGMKKWHQRNKYKGQRLVEILDFWFEKATTAGKIIWLKKKWSFRAWDGIFLTHFLLTLLIRSSYVYFKYLIRKLQYEIESISFSVVSDSATPWTIAHQAPLSMGFSRQEY